MYRYMWKAGQTGIQTPHIPHVKITFSSSVLNKFQALIKRQ